MPGIPVIVKENRSATQHCARLAPAPRHLQSLTSCIASSASCCAACVMRTRTSSCTVLACIRPLRPARPSQGKPAAGLLTHAALSAAASCTPGLMAAAALACCCCCWRWVLSRLLLYTSLIVLYASAGEARQHTTVASLATAVLTYATATTCGMTGCRRNAQSSLTNLPCRCWEASPPIIVGLLCMHSIGTRTAAYTSRSGSMYKSAAAPGASCRRTACCCSQYSRLSSSASGRGWYSGQGSRCRAAAAKAVRPGLAAGASEVAAAGAGSAAGAGLAEASACSTLSTSCEAESRRRSNHSTEA